MRWVARAPNVMGGVNKFHFRQFSVSCSQTSSCARKPLVLRHRCIVYTSMWQVSSGLKEDEMGSQGPQCHVGVKKIHFRQFSVSCSQTSSCARKPLVLRHRCIVYTSMWQVSSGLKEDEMGSLGSQCHGECQKIPFSRVFGFLLPNQLLCQEAASTTTQMYSIYKYVASLIRIERG